MLDKKTEQVPFRGSKIDPFAADNRRADLNARIMREYLKGLSINDIAKNMNCDKQVVKAVVIKTAARATVRKEVNKYLTDVVKTKGETFEEILALGCEKVKEFLTDMPPIQDVKEAKVVADIIVNLHEMIRKELGIAAQNIVVHHNYEHKMEETKTILAELASKDPVFEYPKIDGPDVRPTEEKTNS